MPQKRYNLKYFSKNNPSLYMPFKTIRMFDLSIPIDPELHPSNYLRDSGQRTDPNCFSYFYSLIDFKRIVMTIYDPQTKISEYKIEEKLGELENFCVLKEFLVGNFFLNSFYQAAVI